MTTRPPRRVEPRPRSLSSRTLTFWLRPDFVLRVVNRFQKIAGFDRSVALASSALTAMIPLAIVVSAVASRLGGKDAADRIIDRYELTGGGAEAVKDVFAPPGGTSTSLGIIGFLFLLLAVLSFTRAHAAAVRADVGAQAAERPQHASTGSGGSPGWRCTSPLSGVLHAVLGRHRLELTPALLLLPVSAVFLVWTGRVLSAKRLDRRRPRAVRRDRRGGCAPSTRSARRCTSRTSSTSTRRATG